MMKDLLRQLLNPVENQILARQVMREYLQALLLQSLPDRKSLRKTGGAWYAIALQTMDLQTV